MCHRYFRINGQTKIDLVKKSLKVLVDIMEKTDRIWIILFSDSAKNFFDLNYLRDEIKNKLYNINK